MEEAHHDWPGMLATARQPSLLIIGDEEDAFPSNAALSRMAAATGFRIVDQVPLARATARLARLVDIDAVALRCGGEEPRLEAFLPHLDLFAARHGTKLMAIVDLAGLDRVDALLESRGAAILCQPNELELTAALLSLRARGSRGDTLNDIGREKENDQIERLNEQLVRLNHTIEALVQNRRPVFAPEEEVSWFGPDVRSPGRSYAAMTAELFADPAWDIMLDLMAARLERTKVSVSSLCIAAAVPPTTALRWIRNLTDIGLLERQADPDDGRRIFIGLSQQGTEAVQRWFRESRTHLMAALGLKGGS